MPLKRFVLFLAIGLWLVPMGHAFAQEPEEDDEAPVVFFGTQFSLVDEGEKFRQILAAFGSVDYFSQLREGELVNLVLAEAEAGEGTLDLVGVLHSGFMALQDEDVFMDLSPLLETLSKDRLFSPEFVRQGRLGTEDDQYYIPWMQATYIMAAHRDAFDYLPEGADVMAMTWDDLKAWAENIYNETGTARLGFPVGEGGLWHRFMEGYIYPSYTGGMVTQFRSEGAAEMFAYLKALWPYVHPQSNTYTEMYDPLLAGEVWIAFDHVARLFPAFAGAPDEFVAFPAPSGPEGLGFMQVVVGLGIPQAAPRAAGAEALIDFLTLPETQDRIARELAFFPVLQGTGETEFSPSVTSILDAVNVQANSEDALMSSVPSGLGEHGEAFNDLYRAAFARIVVDDEAIQPVLEEEAANLQALLDAAGAPCWPPDPPSEGVCQVE